MTASSYGSARSANIGQPGSAGPAGTHGRGGAKLSGSTRFWDRMAESYSRRPIADEGVYEKKLAITREYLRPDMEVMEFGCGTGSTALRNAAHVRHIVATDISSKMIEIARRKSQAESVGNVTFRQSGFEEFDAPEASFDMVMGHSILHLLDDRRPAIAKVHRLLKPGGVFVSSTACLADGMNYLRLILPIGRALGLLPLVRFFSAKELENDLIAAGFEIEHNWKPGKGKAVFIIARKAE